MSSPFHVPIGLSTYTDVQPMYWVAGQWMVPSSHLAQVPITPISSSLGLGHTGHAVHLHQSECLSGPYWSRHDQNDQRPEQYRENSFDTAPFETQSQGYVARPGPSRRAPAPYHGDDHRSEPSTLHAKAVSRRPIGHTRDSAKNVSPSQEHDQNCQPNPSPVDSTESDRATRRHQAHLNSEKRRRESINAGIEALRQVLPGTNENDSKAILLDKAVQYILHLETLLRDSRSCEGRAMGRSPPDEIDEVKTELE